MRTRDRERYRRLAQVLRERREGLDLSQSALSRRSGVAQPLISDFEHHERIPNVFDLLRLFRALGINADQGFAILDSLLTDSSLDRASAPPPPRLTRGRPKESRA